jgi:exodeoxyribonuclease III
MSKPIKIITWNVNGIRACYDKGLPQFVAETKADILCLQETKAHIESVETETKTLGYKKWVWSSAEKKGYSGVALYTNLEPLMLQESIGNSVYDNEGRIVRGIFPHFDIYNIYFPNGASGPERHHFKQKFLAYLKSYLEFELKKGRDIILVGDYNVAHKDVDVYSPQGLIRESGFLPEEKKWMNEFLDLGFIDCFRFLNPQRAGVYSWWSYKDQARQKNNGWRIDYICASKNLIKNLKSCDVMMDVHGSDHCPVQAIFEF